MLTSRDAQKEHFPTHHRSFMPTSAGPPNECDPECGVAAGSRSSHAAGGAGHKPVAPHPTRCVLRQGPGAASAARSRVCACPQRFATVTLSWTRRAKHCNAVVIRHLLVWPPRRSSMESRLAPRPTEFISLNHSAVIRIIGFRRVDTFASPLLPKIASVMMQIVSKSQNTRMQYEVRIASLVWALV